MSGRDIRLKAILNIITDSRISSQDQLLQRLDENGVSITQATLSRDLKILKVGKVSDMGGRYYYVLPENKGESLERFREDFRRGYLSMAFSGNLCVIKTLAGHANSVAVTLDRLESPEMLGTIAGDDTILVILAESVGREDFTARLESLVGSLEAL